MFKCFLIIKCDIEKGSQNANFEKLNQNLEIKVN